jgi:hypothetical protein
MAIIQSYVSLSDLTAKYQRVELTSFSGLSRVVSGVGLNLFSDKECQVYLASMQLFACP